MMYSLKKKIKLKNISQVTIEIKGIDRYSQRIEKGFNKKDEYLILFNGYPIKTDSDFLDYLTENFEKKLNDEKKKLVDTYVNDSE